MNDYTYRFCLNILHLYNQWGARLLHSLIYIEKLETKIALLQDLYLQYASST